MMGGNTHKDLFTKQKLRHHMVKDGHNKYASICGTATTANAAWRPRRPRPPRPPRQHLRHGGHGHRGLHASICGTAATAATATAATTPAFAARRPRPPRRHSGHGHRGHLPMETVGKSIFLLQLPQGATCASSWNRLLYFQFSIRLGSLLG
jgi:hypothetical protein